jgi:hypothetical protein
VLRDTVDVEVIWKVDIHGERLGACRDIIVRATQLGEGFVTFGFRVCPR